MITNISIASVFVKDVDESKRFYIDVLGFDEEDDITLGTTTAGAPCVHPNQPELQVHLAIPGPPHSPDMVEAISRAQDEGGMHGLGLNVDDCRKTVRRPASSKGVEFIQDPEERPYGVEARAARQLRATGWSSSSPSEYTARRLRARAASSRWLRSERQRASRNHSIEWFETGRGAALLNHRES